MTHYIWRWRRTSERDGDILTHTTERNAMCVSGSGEVHRIGNKSDGNGTAGLRIFFLRPMRIISFAIIVFCSYPIRKRNVVTCRKQQIDNSQIISLTYLVRESLTRFGSAFILLVFKKIFPLLPLQLWFPFCWRSQKNIFYGLVSLLSNVLYLILTVVFICAKLLLFLSHASLNVSFKIWMFLSVTGFRQLWRRIYSM